jgi:hypothetical protein
MAKYTRETVSPRKKMTKYTRDIDPCDKIAKVSQGYRIPTYDKKVRVSQGHRIVSPLFGILFSVPRMRETLSSVIVVS